jgi:hypothetical protein
LPIGDWSTKTLARASAPGSASCAPGRLGRLAEVALARAGYSTSCISVLLPEPEDAGHRHQVVQRELDGDVLQVVVARAPRR